MARIVKEKKANTEDPYGIFQQMYFPINRKNFIIRKLSITWFSIYDRMGPKYALHINHKNSFTFDDLWEYCKSKYFVKEAIIYKRVYQTFIDFNLNNLTYLNSLQNTEILAVYRAEDVVSN